jgi:hypothetical protein
MSEIIWLWLAERVDFVAELRRLILGFCFPFLTGMAIDF